MFLLGQKVTSKKTGMSMEGIIVSICSPVMAPIMKLAFRKAEALEAYPRWTDLYPDWTDNLTYIVLVKTPMRSMSWDEALKCGATEEEYEAVKPEYLIMYPEADLELVEEGIYVPVIK
jgi:hypothetical protein